MLLPSLGLLRLLGTSVHKGLVEVVKGLSRMSSSQL
jgi:hypothetical protein